MERQCSGHDRVQRYQQIVACTGLIESSRLAPEYLANAFSNRGTAYKANARTSIARFADLHEAIRLNPADAFCNRGFSYYSKQELDRAIMDFDEAIRIDPEMTEAFYGRGLARSAMGAHEEAIADFDKVVRRDLEMQARSISAAIPTPKRGAGSRD